MWCDAVNLKTGQSDQVSRYPTGCGNTRQESINRPGLGGCGEADPLVALCELDVEVGDEGLHVIVPLDLQVEGGGEGDVRLRARLDVDLLDQAGVRHHLQEKELGKENSCRLLGG